MTRQPVAEDVTTLYTGDGRLVEVLMVSNLGRETSHLRLYERPAGADKKDMGALRLLRSQLLSAVTGQRTLPGAPFRGALLAEGDLRGLRFTIITVIDGQGAQVEIGPGTRRVVTASAAPAGGFL